MRRKVAQYKREADLPMQSPNVGMEGSLSPASEKDVRIEMEGGHRVEHRVGHRVGSALQVSQPTLTLTPTPPPP
jgi:hypothetical protein